VRVSFLEIYNEELTDLLGAESVENPRLKIYEDILRKVLAAVVTFYRVHHIAWHCYLSEVQILCAWSGQCCKMFLPLIHMQVTVT